MSDSSARAIRIVPWLNCITKNLCIKQYKVVDFKSLVC